MSKNGKEQSNSIKTILIKSAAILPAILLGVVMFCLVTADKHIRLVESAHTSAQLSELAAAEKSRVYDYMQNCRMNAVNIAESASMLATVTTPQMSQYLMKLAEKNDFSDIYIIEKSGRAFGTGYEAKYVQARLDYGKLYAGDVSVSQIFASVTGEQEFAVSAPVYKNDSIIAVAACVYTLDKLATVIDTSCMEGRGYMHIFQADGTFIIRSSRASGLSGSPSIKVLKNAAFEQGYSYDAFERNINQGRSGMLRFAGKQGASKYAYYTPLGVNNWYIMTVVPASAVNVYADRIARITVQLTVMVCLCFVGLMLIMYLHLKRKQQTLSRANGELAVAKERLDIAISHSTCFMLEYEYAAGRTKVLSDFTGRAKLPESYDGIYLPELVHPADRQKCQHMYIKLINGAKSVTDKLRMRGAEDSQEFRWYRTTWTNIMSQDGSVLYAVGTLEDIDRQISNEQSLHERATHDPLTSLLNRGEFERLLEEQVFSSSDDAAGFFLLMDIDDFKHINDTYGHTAGDRALIELAGLLSRTFRATDAVGRLGGDEFMIYMPGVSDVKLASARVEALRGELKALNVCGTHLTVSVGIVNVRQNESFGMIYRRADNAMYDAKQSGKDRTCTGTEDAPVAGL